MVTAGEFNIFHIGAGSFQCAVGITRTVYRNYVVGIAVENAEFHILGCGKS